MLYGPEPEPEPYCQKCGGDVEIDRTDLYYTCLECGHEGLTPEGVEACRDDEE